MSAGQLRGMETRIAEDMTSVLDFLSRLQGAIEDGNWNYAHDKAGQLVGAAKQLEAALGYEVDRKRSDPAARSKAVIAAIRRYARHYSAGRTLYPAPVEPEREPPAEPGERRPGFRYFTGEEDEVWRVHPLKVEYFEHVERRWIEDDDVTVDGLELREAGRTLPLSPTAADEILPGGGRS